MDLQAFGDLWEHVRLLSDQRRTEALIALLARRAPGATVLEIGCGSGLLSCLAARLGASRVIAVEPTEQAEAARVLVEQNGLGDVVEVIAARIQDLEPRPVDLAFSELLNAEPFAEEVLDAMDAAAPWLAPGGRLAPRRMRVWVALIRDNSSAVEVRDVRALLDRVSRTHHLDLSPLLDELDALEPYRYFSPELAPVTAPVCVADLKLGTGERPPAHQRLRLPVTEAGPIGGAALWFEAELDDGLVLDNAPGHPGHWGHLVLGWPVEVGGPRGGAVEVDVVVDDEEITVTPA
jgi:SAM-dependent methyltransferase